MESSSQSGSPPKPRSYRLADFVGTVIAILTLVLPTLVISYYSSFSSAAPSGYSSDRATQR